MSPFPSESSPPPPDYLSTTQFSFVDIHGRRVHLRGVNLSGAAKAPLSQPSHILKDFWENAEAGGESFVGQPLNLEDGSADEHLARLRGWGFNLLRFPVTWEALEHAGPKKYDYQFMDYIVRVLLKCKEYGFRVYMDPHQDTWSRFSGGSGAPFWTLAACGINPYNLSATQAALIHSEWPLPHKPDPASFPAMIWGTNYGRLLSLTLFTLFFAGRTFAPNCIIDEMNIQEYLQSHFIAAFGELADRVKAADEEEGAGLRDSCIIGWDSLNEPAEGLVEWEDLNSNPTRQGTTLKKGSYPTPAQSLRLGMGKPQTVECWDFGTFGPKRDGSVTIDPKGRKIWADPDATGAEGGEAPDGSHPRWGWKRDVSKWKLGECIWAQHGVWDVESGFVLRPDYFKYDPATGIEVEFITDFWLAHFRLYGERIRRAHPRAILFVQPPVFALPPSVSEQILQGRCAYTGHYYDGLTLITKHWNWFNADSLGVLRGKYKSPLQAVKFGEKSIRKSLMEQIATLKEDAKIIAAFSSDPGHSSAQPPLPPTLPLIEYPTVIGEIGTPFDMDKKYAYFTSPGDFSSQEKALDASLNACDGYNNVAYTIWTYIPQGHSHEWGDAWNGEDLSLWSPDDMRSAYLGKPGDVGLGPGLRRRKGSQPPPNSGRGESQAGLLVKSSGIEQGFGSQNPSMLSINTLPALGVANGLGSNKSDSHASLSPPLGSSPTLPLLKKPSMALSMRTAVTDTQPLPKGYLQPHPASSSLSIATWSRDFEPDEDPYDFLTDGARAVRAFCRPRAVKTFGKVLDTKFEIAKAEFKCVIQAAPGSGSSGVESAAGGDEEATEIFLPLVHFADRKLLEESKARWDPTGSSSVLEMSKQYVRRWKNGGAGVTGNGVDPLVKAGECHGMGRRLLEGIEEREDLLDVEVKVSGGRWKIKGQTLFWWYPSSPAEETEYTIEVKRRGGQIKSRKGGWVEPKSWRRPQQGNDVDGATAEKSFCERLFDCEGCIVM